MKSVVTPPVSKCHAQRLQAGYVTRQLEYPQYPHDTEDLCNTPHLRLAKSFVLTEESRSNIDLNSR